MVWLQQEHTIVEKKESNIQFFSQRIHEGFQSMGIHWAKFKYEGVECEYNSTSSTEFTIKEGNLTFNYSIEDEDS